MLGSIVVDGVATHGRLARGAGLLLLLAAGAVLATNSVACVDTGHVGVVTLFGRVTGRTLPEGIHLVNPWPGYPSSASRPRKSRSVRPSRRRKG